jgi:hypothetical protein
VITYILKKYKDIAFTRIKTYKTITSNKSKTITTTSNKSKDKAIKKNKLK